MSDLYLVLRRRLESVTDWVPLGSDVMRDARKRLGLSYEGVARLIPVSSKTWERWEKRGEVPRPHLRKVAEALSLQVEFEDEQRAIRVPRGRDRDPVPARLAAIEAEIRKLRRAVEGLAT